LAAAKGPYRRSPGEIASKGQAALPKGFMAFLYPGPQPNLAFKKDHINWGFRIAPNKNTALIGSADVIVHF